MDSLKIIGPRCRPALRFPVSVKESHGRAPVLAALADYVTRRFPPDAGENTPEALCPPVEGRLRFSKQRPAGVAPAATISQARLLCSSSFTAVSPVSWRPDRLGLSHRRKGCGVHATHASPVPGAVPPRGGRAGQEERPGRFARSPRPFVGNRSRPGQVLWAAVLHGNQKPRPPALDSVRLLAGG